MLDITRQKSNILVLVIAGILLITSTSMAEKPSGTGDKGNGDKHEQKEKRDSNSDRNEGSSKSKDQHGDDVKVSAYFGDHQRNVIRNFYAEQYRSGNCPPGLAKKNNGCMPPGQARKWQVGKPLPPDVIEHNLPQEVIVQLGLPPARHRYTRVASDILLIAEGTGVVVDAIQDSSEN